MSDISDKEVVNPPSPTQDEDPLMAYQACLLDVSEPIAKRTHAAFYIRTLFDTSKQPNNGTSTSTGTATAHIGPGPGPGPGRLDCLQAIMASVTNKDDCSLMRHEMAYILGQMGHVSAVGVLLSVLEDLTDDPLVRHEAAEALGAIDTSSSSPYTSTSAGAGAKVEEGGGGGIGERVLSALRAHSSDEHVEVRETCQIAIELILWRQQQQKQQGQGLFLSVDPAPPLSVPAEGGEVLSEEYASSTSTAPSALAPLLVQPSLSLFHRYRIMFTLRDINTDESALALTKGFEDPSALFRHEVAYVLGQMQRGVTIDALEDRLRDFQEHSMVRHEAAEALGAIGGERVAKLLQEYTDDSDQCVAGSCAVALDTIDYWEKI